MSKTKIRRGLSDQEMVGKFQEKETFEHGIEEEPVKIAPPSANKKESFFTPELQEKVAKGLLEIKLALFQQGILDYEIKVAREGNTVSLTAVPKAAARSKKQHT